LAQPTHVMIFEDDWLFVQREHAASPDLVQVTPDRIFGRRALMVFTRATAGAGAAAAAKLASEMTKADARIRHGIVVEVDVIVLFRYQSA
jgi:hypothetical protein